MSGEGRVHTARRGADEVRRCLNDQIAEWQRPVADLAEAVIESADRSSPSGPAILHERDLVDLVPRAEQLAESARGIIGAGFIAEPGLVDGRSRYMLWLQKRNGVTRRLRLNFDTDDLDAYDYVRMDWYRGSWTNRAARLTGPYLDYSGADHVVVTLTVPAFRDHEFLGVTGIDLLAQDVENVLVGHLRELDGPAVVFNNERLVVAASSTRFMPGERVAASDVPDSAGLRLVVPLVDWSGWTMGVT